VSPLNLRRFRADRLLRSDFKRLRAAVTASAERRLSARGIHVDRSDLDALYAQAWHGLYSAVLDGEEIANPAGWLALVTFRRGIDEYRPRARASSLDDADAVTRRSRRAFAGAAAEQPDYAAALDDRIRLRQLMEALRIRLSAREREAASLCYLQGLSRSQAAERMGVSESSMRKIMDGHRGRRGVAHKVGAFVGTIESGEWCAAQGSLMRAFAHGILDPAGERYVLALAHQNDCPACRSYVLSLRGLAALLPPVPWLAPWALAAGAGVSARAGASAGVPAVAGGGAPTASAIGVGAGATVASASGAAGGGWLLAAGSGAKLAAGCLLALSVGAGCVALTIHRDADAVRDGTRAQAGAASARASGRAPTPVRARLATISSGRSFLAAGASGPALASTAKARREFGLEVGRGPAPEPVSASRAASAARAGTGSLATAPSSGRLRTDGARRTGAQPTASAPERLASAAAVHEFSPG
jgi:RNA polymerase sigma factor (sigma-70 family)